MNYREGVRRLFVILQWSAVALVLVAAWEARPMPKEPTPWDKDPIVSPAPRADLDKLSDAELVAEYQAALARDKRKPWEKEWGQQKTPAATANFFDQFDDPKPSAQRNYVTDPKTLRMLNGGPPTWQEWAKHIGLFLGIAVFDRRLKLTLPYLAPARRFSSTRFI